MVRVEEGGAVLGTEGEARVSRSSEGGGVGGGGVDVGVTRVTVRVDERVRGGEEGARESGVLREVKADLLAGATGVTSSPGER